MKVSTCRWPGCRRVGSAGAASRAGIPWCIDHKPNHDLTPREVFSSLLDPNAVPASPGPTKGERVLPRSPAHLMQMLEQFKEKAVWWDDRDADFCVVYFVYARDVGRVKIGRASNPYRRLKRMQTFSPVPLSVLGFVADDKELESRIHAEFQHLRRLGEWFDTDDSFRRRVDVLLGGSNAVRLAEWEES